MSDHLQEDEDSQAEETIFSDEDPAKEDEELYPFDPDQE
jgi:hypothetical protein